MICVVHWQWLNTMLCVTGQLDLQHVSKVLIPVCHGSGVLPPHSPLYYFIRRDLWPEPLLLSLYLLTWRCHKAMRWRRRKLLGEYRTGSHHVMWLSHDCHMLSELHCWVPFKLVRNWGRQKKLRQNLCQPIRLLKTCWWGTVVVCETVHIVKGEGGKGGRTVGTP